ncbi:MAG: hypothetical protein K9G59_16135 [Caulobacter sp.]|nr:hypothetical protein [Caulobacter sp.]
MLASASLLSLGSHLARAQMISMREHIRTIAAHFADMGEDRNLIISTVADSAWQSLHAFQTALNFQLSSREEEEMEIDRLLTDLEPSPA